MLRWLLFVCALGSAVLGSSSFAQTSSPQDFERVCDLMEGRWVGDVTWLADWPGLGKRGDKSVAFLNCSRAEDGKGLAIKFFGGSGSATGLAAYDAVNKKIHHIFVVSGGYYGDQEIRVEGDQLTFVGKGSLPDGREHSTTVIRKFSDNGNQFVDTETGEIEGEPTDKAPQTWRKVSGKFATEGSAKDFREFGDLLVGRWIRDIVYIHDWKGAPGGRGAKATGYHEFQWINDGQAVREVSVDGETRGENVFCADPVSNRILCFGSDSTGGSIVGEWKKTGDNQWTLTPIQGGTGDGEKFGGSVIYQFSSDGKRIDTSGIVTLNGKPLDELQDVLRRLSP